MDKNSIFFGENGLTSTSANYIANLAKELMKKEEDDITSLTFVCKQVAPIQSPTSATVTTGCGAEEFGQIEQKLNHVIRLKSLIAWLREAIKAKNEMDNAVTKLSRSEMLKKLGIKPVPQYDDNCGCEDFKGTYTDDEYIATLSIGERNRYYRLQTEAATLGKLIHENGSLSVAREELHTVRKHPNEIKQSGAQLLMYSYLPSMDEAEVDALYYKLQTRYREVQSELNGILHAIDDAVRLENKSREEHNASLRVVWRKQYEDSDVRIRVWKRDERYRISQLRIIIPNALRDIYEEVQRVGK